VRYDTAMQTLWSRAAQSKCTCRCSSCLSSATALARRTTTATGRRRLKFGDAFTLFYSSIFATAAVADAKVKDDRRKKWDTAIAEAKNELNGFDQRESRAAELAGPSNQGAGRVLDEERTEWGEVLKLRPEDLNDRWSLTNMGLTVLPPGLHKQLSQNQIEQILTRNHLLEILESGWKVHPTRKGAVRKGHNPPNSIDAEATTRAPQSLSTKKLRTLELSVAKLVLRFLAQSPSEHVKKHRKGEIPHRTLREPAPTTLHTLLLKIAEMNRHLQRLMKNEESTGENALGWPASPAYERSNPSSDDQERLNNAVRIIFQEQVHTKNLDSMMEKICLQLLLTTSPPDVTTYNLLIVHLTRLKQNEMVRMVLDSFNESHMRPNEITISATLKFYTVSNDRKSFGRYVDRMRGRDGGLALARPDIRITTAGLGRLVCKDEKVIQKAPRNRHIFGALIHGTLKFFGTSIAMRVYLQMIGAGWEPNVVILTSILRDCQSRRDWKEGQAVWQQIRDISGKISDRAYLWMLQLCRVCKRQTVYDEIKEELIRQDMSVSFLQQYPTDKDGAWTDDIQTIEQSWRKQRREGVGITGDASSTDAVQEAFETAKEATAMVVECPIAAKEEANGTETKATAGAANNIGAYEALPQTKEPSLVFDTKGSEGGNAILWD